MTVLVVASPCALVLSIPSAILVAIAAGARRGILFRGGVAVENLAAATLFAFDKTGTLTRGKLAVSRITHSWSKPKEASYRLAAAIATFSTHPLARAVVLAAENRELSFSEERKIFSTSQVWEWRRWLMERESLLAAGITCWNAAFHCRRSGRQLKRKYGLGRPGAGSDLSYAMRSGRRPEGVIDFLKKAGIHVTLLTGDRAEPAAMVAEQVGIDDVRAELSPQAKLQSIHELRAAGNKVAMVGDGINDAPSLTAADVSIGMGARGSDAALEQADVILMHDKIENVEEAFRLSSRARSIIRQNITISLGVIFVLIISALLEKISLTLGVIGHEGSTVLVILNGLRLLRSHR